MENSTDIEEKIKSKISSYEVQISILETMSQEINTYRQRQITMFREAVIVLALVTWGINQLNIQDNWPGWIIRVAAAAACALVGIVGILIILSYKKRIYYIRDERTKRISVLERLLATKKIKSEAFYPTETKRLEKKHKTLPSSKIYIWALVGMSVLTFIVNILDGLATK